MSDTAAPTNPDRGRDIIARLRARAAEQDRTRILVEPERITTQRRGTFASARLAVLDALPPLYQTAGDEDPTALVLRAMVRLAPPELHDGLLDLAEAVEDRFAEEERRRLEGMCGGGFTEHRRRQG